MVLKRVWFVLLIALKSSIALSQPYNAELLLQKTEITLTGNTLIKKIKVEIKVNNRAGEKYTKVEIPYSKTNSIKKLEAYIAETNGKIVKRLKRKDVVDRNAYSYITFFDDNYVKEFTLRHNIYPYSLVYSYEEQYDEFFYVDFWQPVLSPSIPTVNAKLKIDVPMDYKISAKEHLIEKYRNNTVGERNIYNWTTNYKELVEPEIYAPLLNEFLPHVAVVPESVKYGVNGDFSTWKSYGNWQAKLNEGLDVLTEVEKKKINSLVEGIGDTKTKIKALYSYLQKSTRYINVSIGVGGLQPYPASYVCEKKYGDCKALTNYFKAVLKYIGVKAYYTKIYAGDKIIPIDKDFVSQQFNHVILFVPLENDTLWLDCTSDDVFGYIGTFNQGRSAFVIEKDKSRYVTTPALKKNDVLESRKVKVKCIDDEEVGTQFYITYKGRKYEELQWVKKSISTNEREQFIREQYIDKDFQLDKYTLEKLHDDSTAINLKYGAKSNLVYKKYGDDLLIKLLPMAVPEFSKPEYRRLPVKIDYPLYCVDSIFYELPVGYLSENIFEKDTLLTKYGEYYFDIKQESGILKVSKSFYLKKGYYLLQEYEEFYDFIQTIRKKENRTLILTRKE